ncbi:MetQ/NlpA family ABC transporter substrate-binding protein [Marinilactibacillus psychrotolerans]|uniref:Methionine ABC transporter substrate-binding protein n=1 Tax=Marinilactibacillus psychrotolerans TaxID=191770 RepID=A0AAV3WPM9_9LACT|nr:MetQ/NlpA family ABC transporter substrate-binding protein [Marinilactibacillus psychrotolerans]GEL66570.1 lipoprotein [Marinilactibacillus psychrotolerans]GEQ35092.1 methionine ABC transporter substrate-binding protein [Marinilactibacillus psychrotolerans]SDD22044.1 D-methionine transport system substrate-binding protein [Marinilactibacillus psychrotolerans]
MKKKFLVLFSLLLTIVLAACGNDGETVRLGVVGENNEPWEHVKEVVAEEGIDLEIVTFSDYQTPNTALAEGDLDLNAFQTVIFLDSFNEDTGNDLTPIADTTLNPLGVYSEQVEEITDIQEGDTITIPNDASNEGRALILLQSAGLIEVDPEKGNYPLIEDITNNPLNLDIVAIASNQTARSLSDTTAAVINVGMAVDAGYIPSEDAIFLESAEGNTEPYINAIVTRSDETENETYQKIIDAYQTDEVKEIIAETTQNSSIPVW